MAKRAFDLFASIVGLIIILPFFVPVAIVIRLDSRGPAFYKATRIGKDGRPFSMLKLRTMVEGAEEQGPSVTFESDRRVTRVGRFLRRWKIDELPTLVNVFSGDMSLVGPRPETPPYVERYTPKEREVLAVRPGITGPSQIKYRHEESLLKGEDLEDQYLQIMRDKLEIDAHYIASRSFGTDIKYIWKTFQCLLQ
jgi:lipopolysaccharide/colanic/teichoic acid biosynthesis glycosyltransferase